LPPLRAREISPRYNKALKNHLALLKSRQKTPPNNLSKKEKEEIRAFIA
jgi:hypothetical protein